MQRKVNVKGLTARYVSYQPRSSTIELKTGAPPSIFRVPNLQHHIVCNLKASWRKDS